MVSALPGKSGPNIGQRVFIDKHSQILGDVTIADNCSIFFGCALRGDLMPIIIGQGSNVQENSILHTTRHRAPTIVGEYCTIGHGAILHSCTLGNRVLVGMGAIILDQAQIEDETMIGAGTLITENKKFPGGTLILGSPGKVVRDLTAEERAFLKTSAENYIKTGKMMLDAGLGV